MAVSDVSDVVLAFTSSDGSVDAAFSTNNDVLTGYTNELTPFTFNVILSSIVPTDPSDVFNFSNEKIVWDFGDNQTGTGLSTQHVYLFPGIYDVRVTFYDEVGQPYVSKFVQKVGVYNVFDDKVDWNTDAVSNCAVENVKASAPSNRLRINRFNSWQSYQTLSATGYTVNMWASGSKSFPLNVDNHFNNKYGHFDRTWRFVEDPTDPVPVETVQTTSTELYMCDVSGSLVMCSKDTAGSVLVGTSGYADVYYIDDTAKNITSKEEDPVFLFASLDQSQFPDIDVYNNRIDKSKLTSIPLDYYQTSKSVLPIKVRHNPANQLVFTTNGIRGFDISPNKYQNTNITFNVGLADVNDNNTQSFYPELSGTWETGTDDNYVLSAGYFNTHSLSTVFTSNTSMSANSFGSYN